jgi:AcrR family transcriptional regulator
VATARKKRIAPDARRELIEAAAGRLFAEHGYGGTTLDAVAAAAHVTKPMVYRHFASKKDLYLALLARHRDDMPSFLEQTPSDVGWDERMRAVLERWFSYVEERPHGWKMLFRDTTGDPEIRAYRLEVQAAARSIIAGIIAMQSDPPPPERELEALAELVRTGMAGLALWWLDHPEVDRSVLVDAVDRVLAGLRGELSGAPTPSGRA